METERITKLYTRDIERAKAFYERYFDAVPEGKKPNVFAFECGAKCEFILDESKFGKIALRRDCREKLEQITGELDWDGYEILERPHETQNGIYMSCAKDTDGNIVEIISD